MFNDNRTAMISDTSYPELTLPAPVGPALPASAALTLQLRTSLSGQWPSQGRPDAVRMRHGKMFYKCFKMSSSAWSHERVAPVLYFTVIFTHQKYYLFSSGSLKMLG